MSELKRDLERGYKATQYFFLAIAIIVLLLVIYAIAGVVGAIITGVIVGGIIYLVRSGKLKLY